MAANDGGPAFPQNDAVVNRINNEAGMSLRDFFAAAALTGIIAGATRTTLYKDGGGPAPDCMPIPSANDAYHYADAMLRERERIANADQP